MDEKKRTKCVLKQSTAVGPIKGIVQANYIFFFSPYLCGIETSKTRTIHMAVSKIYASS